MLIGNKKIFWLVLFILCSFIHNKKFSWLPRLIYAVFIDNKSFSGLTYFLARFTDLFYLEILKHIYRKNSKNSDTLNYHRDCPTNGIVAFYSAILRSKDSDRITNRVDTDQTDLGLHCLLRPICPNISNYYGICLSILVPGVIVNQ